jgi:hypothetical protein
MRLAVADLVRAINDLDSHRQYRYVNARSTTIIEIESVRLPEGPILLDTKSSSGRKKTRFLHMEKRNKEMSRVVVRFPHCLWRGHNT